MRGLVLITAGLATLLGGAPAVADSGDILMKGRATHHNRFNELTLMPPNSGQTIETGIKDSVGAEASITMFATDRLAFEASLGSTGYQLREPGGNALVSANLLMSTVTVQYHFSPDSKLVRPYVGAGLTHLNLYGDEAEVALLDAAPDPFGSYSTKLTGGFAPVGQVGVDIALDKRFYVNLDAKYTSRKTEVLIEREARTLESRRVDALILAAGVGFRF